MVAGTGATPSAVPPVAAEYHFKAVPVAVSAVETSFKQYVTDEVTVGAAVVQVAAATLTTIAERGLSQVPII